MRLKGKAMKWTEQVRKWRFQAVPELNHLGHYKSEYRGSTQVGCLEVTAMGDDAHSGFSLLS